MTMRRMTNVLTLAASSSVLFLAIGCEDADTQAAVERSEKITTASRAYPAKYFDANREQALQALASDLAAGASGADAGSIIQAAAARDIAAAKLNEAAILESENRGDRAAMSGIARGAARLDTLSGAFASFDESADAAAIEAAGAEAQATLTTVQAAITEIERPVADLQAQNEQDRQEVERLRTQARQLYEKAFELGDLNGFPSFQQAVDLDKQADAIEDRIIEREIELLDLESQLRFAQTHATELNKQIESAAQAQAGLEESATQLEGAASAMQTQTGRFQGAFSEALDRVQQRMDQLAGIYDSAGAKVDEAVRSAQAPGAGMIKIRALLLKGHLNRMKAQGLADHVALLTTLSGAAGIGDASQFRSALDAASQDLEAANTAATAAYQEASQALGGVGGSPQQTARLKQQLDAAATGGAAAPAPPPGGFGSGSTPSAPAAPTGAGAESPEALVAAVNAAAAADPVSGAQSIMSLSYPGQLTGVERQGYDAFVNLVNTAVRLDQTLQAKFGQRIVDVDEDLAQLLSMMLSHFDGNTTLLNVSGDEGAVSSNDEDGEDPIIEVNGTWYLLLEPEEDTEGAEMFAQMFQAMVAVYENIDRRINSGELASVEAVQAAIEEASNQMMGGVMESGGGN